MSRIITDPFADHGVGDAHKIPVRSAAVSRTPDGSLPVAVGRDRQVFTVQTTPPSEAAELASSAAQVLARHGAQLPFNTLLTLAEKAIAVTGGHPSTDGGRPVTGRRVR
jgi:hypothetical protein